MNVSKIVNDTEIMDYVEIVTKAYPGMMNNSPESKTKLYDSLLKRLREDDSIEFHGLFRENKLVGAMRLHSYQMNLFSKLIDVGGIGLVAVDLLHKKEKIAKELVLNFINEFKKKNVNMVLLYPFRPDFYKKMGFGYGSKMHQYSISPSSFQNGSTKEHLRYLSIEDKEELYNCYTRYAMSNHGMFLKTEFELETMFKNPDVHLVGYFEEGVMKGYVTFSFKKLSDTNFVYNDLVIKELIFEKKEALNEIATFLHTQTDQIHRIIWNTQEENIHFMIQDPRNGTNNLIPPVYHESHLSGVGLMYRIINIKGIIKDLEFHNFNHSNGKFKLKLIDTFLVENNVELVIHVENGRMNVVQEGHYDVELSIDVSDFSSMVMGAVTLKELYYYSKLELSDEAYLNELNTIFLVSEKPKCISIF